MKLLLDTHIFLWALLEPDRLADSARSALGEADNQLWLSPITVWECLILAGKGRIELKPSPEVWLRESIRLVGLREAPINHEVAMASQALALPHRDPADRFLAATAQVFELTLVTADHRLIEAGGFSVLAST